MGRRVVVGMGGRGGRGVAQVRGAWKGPSLSPVPCSVTLQAPHGDCTDPWYHAGSLTYGFSCDFLCILEETVLRPISPSLGLKVMSDYSEMSPFSLGELLKSLAWWAKPAAWVGWRSGRGRGAT